LLPARDVVQFRIQIQTLVDRVVAVRNARVEVALNKAKVGIGCDLMWLIEMIALRWYDMIWYDMICWLVDRWGGWWLVDWFDWFDLIGWLIDWLIDYLIDWIDWIDWMDWIDWYVWLIDWLMEDLICWDWLMDWFVGWLILIWFIWFDSLIGWLNDWFDW
jgi:hypothetical protein